MDKNTPPPMPLADRYQQIRVAINNTLKNSILTNNQVAVLAASKGQPAPRIEEAVAAGITDFGENRVQEAAAKWPELKKRHPQLRLHLIGPLQTNKAAQAIRLFDVIQTLDRPALAEAMEEAMAKTGRRIPCLIQVNTGKEPQKAGIFPEQADDFIAGCMERWRLPVEGLMCIPPADQPPAPHFALLRAIAARHGLSQLSMGMSDDFETALRMGSTCIRLGRALFGERP